MNKNDIKNMVKEMVLEILSDTEAEERVAQDEPNCQYSNCTAAGYVCYDKVLGNRLGIWCPVHTPKNAGPRKGGGDLDEVSTTGGVSAPATKFAFSGNSKKLRNRAALSSVGGSTIVKDITEKKEATPAKKSVPAPKQEPVINEPIRRDDAEFINKEKKTAVAKKDTKKIKHITKLQGLVKRSAPYLRVDEDVDFNIKKEKDDFDASIETTEFQLVAEKTKVLKSKLVGKKVTAHAAKGQPGQVKKDYTIDVSDVKITDYYGKYEISLVDSAKKEYFVDTTYKIKILGGEAATPQQTAQQTPAQPKAGAEAPPANAAVPAANPTNDLSKEIQK